HCIVHCSVDELNLTRMVHIFDCDHLPRHIELPLYGGSERDPTPFFCRPSPNWRRWPVECQPGNVPYSLEFGSSETSQHAQGGAEGSGGLGDGTGSSETFWRISRLCIPESVGGGQPMCNLYSMTKSRNEVNRLFKVGHNRAVMFEGREAIFPS